MTDLDPSVRLGIDVGGTFTDLVITDGRGTLLGFHKVATTKPDPSDGILEVLGEAASALGKTAPDLLSQCSAFVLGTTVATNQVLQRAGGLTGLVVTEGFRDSLAIRRGKRDYTALYDYRRPHPEPIVPRWLRVAVRERIGADGHVIDELDEDSVRSAAGAFRAASVQAVAVSLMHAYRNPAHEERVAELIASELPETPVYMSSAILPLIGEYERTSTTTLSAYLAPETRRFLAALESRLIQNGLRVRPMIMQSNGGVDDIRGSLARPAGLVLSGPAAGAAAAALFGAHLGERRLILIDMGGTSTDVTVVEDGVAARRSERQINGLDLKLPSVDVETIGTGGGTVAHVDAAGLLHVGPRGAGSTPGPACYGRGGLEPTVTDANLVLGRLDPANFLGGQIPLRPELARESIERAVARPLGMTTEQAALAIVRLANENMVDALSLVSLQRGRDPRSFALIAAGGAAGLHASYLARALEMRSVYIPREAAVCCALGVLNSDIRQDSVRHFDTRLDNLERSALESAITALESAARQRVVEQGFDVGRLVFERSMDMRYVGQHAELTVPLPDRLPDDLPNGVAEAFHVEHERLNGHRDPDGQIEVLALRLTSVIAGAPVQLPDRQATTRSGPGPLRRSVYIEELGGFVSVPVYVDTAVAPEDEIRGPALIEESTTTILVLPGDRVVVDRYGSYVLTPAAPVTRDSPHETRATSSDDASGTDPVVLAIVERRLDAITREMGATMSKSARSLIFSEAHDFSCFVADPVGTVLSQADGIPIHTGSGGFAIRSVMRAASDVFENGDVWLLNDPYFGGGAHLPDWIMVRPVIRSGGLVAFVCNKAHQNDLGGNAFGGYNYGAREIFQEGIRLPAVKLVDGGRLRDDVFRLLCYNSRVPDQMAGDLRAMLGSLEVGARRLVTLHDDLGTSELGRYFAALLAYSERRMRAELAAIPDGTYRATNPLIVAEDDPDTTVPITVEITVRGSDVTVDLTESAGMVPTFKNSAATNTHAAVYAAFATTVDPGIPHNEGAYRPIKVILAPDSVVNASPPKPVGNSTTHPADEIIHACWQALAQALPERASAGWGYAVCPRIQGTANDGSPFIDAFVEMSLSGAGAVFGRDGFDAAGPLETLGGLTASNLEMFERLYPVVYERCEYRCDSGGSGQFRGGTGLDIVVRGTQPMRVSFFSRLMLGEGFRARTTYGVGGGAAGAETLFLLQDGDGTALGAAATGYEADLDSFTMIVQTEGGGGWGDPHHRDPERVARDVRDGLISQGAAGTVYLPASTPEGLPRRRDTP